MGYSPWGCKLFSPIMPHIPPEIVVMHNKLIYTKPLEPVLVHRKHLYVSLTLLSLNLCVQGKLIWCIEILRKDSKFNLQNETQLNKYYFLLVLDTQICVLGVRGQAEFIWGKSAFSVTAGIRVRNLSSDLIN